LLSANTTVDLNSSIGTVAFKAPETYKGPFTVQSDIFSFGMLCYEIATRKQVFAANVPAQLVTNKICKEKFRPNLGNKIDYNNGCVNQLQAKINYHEMIRKCWQHNSKDRFQSFQEIINFLKTFCKTAYLQDVAEHAKSDAVLWKNLPLAEEPTVNSLENETLLNGTSSKKPSSQLPTSLGSPNVKKRNRDEYEEKSTTNVASSGGSQSSTASNNHNGRNDQKKKRKKELGHSKTRKCAIIFSGFKQDLEGFTISVKNELMKIVQVLGGEIIDEQKDEFDPKVTHVVCPPQVRTMKILAAALTQKWLVHPDWIRKSKEAGYFVDETQYGLIHRVSPFNQKTVFISQKFIDASQRANKGARAKQTEHLGKGSITKDIATADIVLLNNNEEPPSTLATCLTWEKFIYFIHPKRNPSDGSSSKY